MDPLLEARLRNQFLASPATSVLEVVSAMGALQAQDFGAGKWALGVRVKRSTERAIDRLLDEGAIVRTHPMRGTHHFLAREDIRWMLSLLAPRSLAKFATRQRSLGLGARVLEKSLRVLENALAERSDLTRAEVSEALRRARISTDGQRLPHIIMYAELAGLVCSGPRRGTQITIALLERRVPRTAELARDAALAELARRYFATRGPATLQDFVWWCGLTVADARAAVEHARLAAVTIDGIVYWRGANRRGRAEGAYLLPPFDEYTVAYKNRERIGIAPKTVRGAMEQWLLAPNVVVDGKVVGTWRSGKTIAITPWRKLTARERSAVDAATTRYAGYKLS